MTPTVRRLAFALSLSLLAGSGALAARVYRTGPLGGCPAGSYRFLVADDPKLREVEIRDGGVALLPGCNPSKAQLTVEERGAQVAAEWPACQGASGRVKLEGHIHGSWCELFDGTLEVGKAKPREVHADLVRCQVQYPNAEERRATIARAVSACLTDLQGDPWKDAQDFGTLYYAVQAKLGCALDGD